MQRDGCEEHETGAAQTVQGRWQGLPLQGRIFFFLLARDDQSQALKKKKSQKKIGTPATGYGTLTRYFGARLLSGA